MPNSSAIHHAALQQEECWCELLCKIIATQVKGVMLLSKIVESRFEVILSNKWVGIVSVLLRKQRKVHSYN